MSYCSERVPEGFGKSANLTLENMPEITHVQTINNKCACSLLVNVQKS